MSDLVDKCVGKGKDFMPMNEKCIGCNLLKIECETLEDWSSGMMVHKYVVGLLEKEKCKRDE